jgi:hypothetical protein
MQSISLGAGRRVCGELEREEREMSLGFRVNCRNWNLERIKATTIYKELPNETTNIRDYNSKLFIASYCFFPSACITSHVDSLSLNVHHKNCDNI